MTSIPPFAAHYRASDKQWQTLDSHLLGVAKLASRFAAKLELSAYGELLGLLHDFGKYSHEFQAYDVATDTRAGRRRLRRVAKACESMGQRVQKSVFECQLDEMQFEQLERRLHAEIDESEDSLRFYRITEAARVRVKEYGNIKAKDFDGPLLA